MPVALTGAVALLLALLALFTPPAAAHGDEALLSVETAEPAGAGTSVHYVITMVYENDGEPVSGKVVTATPTGPDGVARPGVTMTPLEEGRYETTLEMPEPGAWTVTFASADPEGSLAHPEVRPEAPPSTTTTSTTEPAESEGSEAADDAGAGPADESAAGAPADDDDGGGSGAVPAILVAVVVAAALAASVVVIRHRRADSTT